MLHVVDLSPPVPDQIGEIANDVQGLWDDGNLNNGQANPLLNFLDQAVKDFNKGKPIQAIKKLRDFIDREELLSDGTLANDQGQPLIDAALTTIGNIEATL